MFTPGSCTEASPDGVCVGKTDCKAEADTCEAPELDDGSIVIDETSLGELLDDLLTAGDVADDCTKSASEWRARVDSAGTPKLSRLWLGAA